MKKILIILILIYVIILYTGSFKKACYNEISMVNFIYYKNKTMLSGKYKLYKDLDALNDKCYRIVDFDRGKIKSEIDYAYGEKHNECNFQYITDNPFNNKLQQIISWRSKSSQFATIYFVNYKYSELEKINFDSLFKLKNLSEDKIAVQYWDSNNYRINEIAGFTPITAKAKFYKIFTLKNND